MKDEYEIAEKVFNPGVDYKATDDGIRIFVVSQPSIYRDVKIPNQEIKDEVIKWHHAPPGSEPENWNRIQSTVFEVQMCLLKLMVEWGSVQKALLLARMRKLIAEQNDYGTAVTHVIFSLVCSSFLN